MARAVTTRRKVITTAAAWAIGLLIFFPIYWTILTSFKTEAQAINDPPLFFNFDWTLENSPDAVDEMELLKEKIQEEQLKESESRNRINELSDVYVLGAILFQIASGYPPHLFHVDSQAFNAGERLVLGRGGEVRGTVLDSSGRPA